MESQNEQSTKDTPVDAVRRETPVKQGFWASFWDLARFTGIVLLIVIGVRTFIAQPFIVSGTSMVPTFQDKNYLIIDELSYRFVEPKRGDVVVFHPPYDKKIFLIKRIIGVPGDTVEVKDGVVTITNTEHPDGIIISEPYINKEIPSESISQTVTDGNYFVMGDNRTVSYDSRRWGLLSEKNITGRALVRLFPINEIDLFPGEHTY